LEVFSDGNAASTALTDILSTRIDLLTVYDEKGHDVYAPVMADPALRQLLENAALSHYVNPPEVPVELPRRISEW
jgi:hypothetical protein